MLGGPRTGVLTVVKIAVLNICSTDDTRRHRTQSAALPYVAYKYNNSSSRVVEPIKVYNSSAVITYGIRLVVVTIQKLLEAVACVNVSQSETR